MRLCRDKSRPADDPNLQMKMLQDEEPSILDDTQSSRCVHSEAIRVDPKTCDAQPSKGLVGGLMGSLATIAIRQASVIATHRVAGLLAPHRLGEGDGRSRRPIRGRVRLGRHGPLRQGTGKGSVQSCQGVRQR